MLHCSQSVLHMHLSGVSLGLGWWLILQLSSPSLCYAHLDLFCTCAYWQRALDWVDLCTRILSNPEFLPRFSSLQGSFFLVLLAKYTGFFSLQLHDWGWPQGSTRKQIKHKTDLKKKRKRKSRHYLLFPTHWLHKSSLSQSSDQQKQSSSRAFCCLCPLCIVLGLEPFTVKEEVKEEIDQNTYHHTFLSSNFTSVSKPPAILCFLESFIFAFCILSKIFLNVFFKRERL